MSYPPAALNIRHHVSLRDFNSFGLPAVAATLVHLSSEAELKQFARDHLAHFKAPHGVTFVSELPKTATGKIQKFVLRGGRSAVTRQ